MSTDDAETGKDTEATPQDDTTAEDAATADQPDDISTEKPDRAEKDNAEKKDDRSAAKAENSKRQPRKADPEASAGKSSLVAVVAAFVAGVLAVAAITALVVFYRQAQDRGDKLDGIADATRAACDFGRDVSEYDYSKNLDDYFNKVKAGATGEWLKEFDDAKKALTDAMVQAQVKSWTDDVQCGYQSGDDTTANVLVTLTQYKTNFAQQAPDRTYIVVVAELQKSDGKWLVNKLDSPMLKGEGTGLPGGASTPAPSPGQPPAPQPGN